MQTRPLRFIFRGREVALRAVPPTLTVLDWLREDRRATGTKEGCAEGDCGACTVVLAEPHGGGLRWRAVNACIRFLSSIDGCALFTVEDLRAPDGTLHPVQQAMVDHHGSQCGFCTPGFVMSLFALYQSRIAGMPGDPALSGPEDDAAAAPPVAATELRRPRAPTRAEAREALSGNLCRCTGYRPILDAAEALAAYPVRRITDEAALAATLRALREDDAGLALPSPDGEVLRPATLTALLAARRDRPDAQLIAGCTDVGLWTTKQHRRFAATLDLTAVRELETIQETGDGLAIGAAARLSDAYDALVARRPRLAAFAARFASLPVRQSGTLGGNVANGSPIGDSMPLLIALGASVELARLDDDGNVATRTLPLEDFYLAYRKTALAPDEVLARVLVPNPAPDEWMRVYKVSKRFDQDISAVCLGLWLTLDGPPEAEGTRVLDARIGAGGVAAVPARARNTESVLRGRPWNTGTVEAACAAITSEFTPIGDMRATADYRRDVLAGLLRRAWLESRGTVANLEDASALSGLRGRPVAAAL